MFYSALKITHEYFIAHHKIPTYPRRTNLMKILGAPALKAFSFLAKAVPLLYTYKKCEKG